MARAARQVRVTQVRAVYSGSLPSAHLGCPPWLRDAINAVARPLSGFGKLIVISEELKGRNDDFLHLSMKVCARARGGGDIYMHKTVDTEERGCKHCA